MCFAYLGLTVRAISVSCVVSVFACLGFLSPANRGSLMTTALILYVCLGTPAGYVSARIYKSKSSHCNCHIVFRHVYMHKTSEQ